MQDLELYHPERYRKSRPFARQITTIYRNKTGLGKLPSHECFQAVIDVIDNTYNNEIENIPLQKRPKNLSYQMRECSLAMHYAGFYTHGRQIFHFNDEITEQFRKTDVDDISINMLALPYEMLYMSFGKQVDLRLSHSAYVDGAYISSVGGEQLQIILTTIQDDYNSQRFSWIFQPEIYYYLSLPFNNPNKNISELADKALQEDLEERYQTPLQNLPPIMEFQNIAIVNRRLESVESEIQQVKDGYLVFREALRLIINGLCYLSGYPDDIEIRYPDDAPAELIAIINNSKKAKDIQRTVSKLTSRGYTKIHYCGKAFQTRQTSNTLRGKEVQSHWRRGHWRNQPCGSGLSERKLIWIMPVIVRKDKSHELEGAGHIYIVDEPTNIT